MKSICQVLQASELSVPGFDLTIKGQSAVADAPSITAAITAGLQPFPVADLNINAFFGLTLTDSVDNKQSIPFFALERRNFAEQDITQKIFELTHPKKNLGIISTLPVFDTVINNNVVSQEWQIIKQLKELYNITNIKEAQDFPDNLDVLMIINPQNPNKDLVDKIKEYIKTTYLK